MRLSIKIQVCIGITKKPTNAESSIISEFVRGKEGQKKIKKYDLIVGKFHWSEKETGEKPQTTHLNVSVEYRER